MTTEPNKPKPKRRWLQFSLRTFFVLLTVLCVWLGWTVHRANEQRKAVAWVREMGGSVMYDYEWDEDGKKIANGKPPGPKWLAQLLGPEYFQEVSAAQIGSWEVSYFNRLVGLEKLGALNLRHAQISDLTPLAKLTSLKSLELYDTNVSDLTPLAKLTSLRNLVLYDTQVSDLTPLAKLTSLKALVLTNAPVSEEQIKKLQQALPNCEIFWSPPDQSQ